MLFIELHWREDRLDTADIVITEKEKVSIVNGASNDLKTTGIINNAFINDNGTILSYSSLKIATLHLF